MNRPVEELPVWARPESFPPAQPGWGWVDRKGRRRACGSLEELSAAIVEDAGARADLVWTPASGHLVLPEEIPELRPALREARIRWAEWEISEGRRQMLLFGGIVVVASVLRAFRANVISEFGIGLAFLLMLVLGVIPWYQGAKRLRRAKSPDPEPDVEGLRFETWLMFQKAPLTRALVGVMVAIGILQVVTPGSSVEQAALTKVNGRPEDWWRLFTAPFLHGHPLHLLFNVAALAYLGRRVEVFARWPHLATVFLLSAWVGGEASAKFVPVPSLGASGGLLGLLGFLLVFEWMHPQLVPQSSRRRLIAGLVLTAAIGLAGFRLIDNAAHGGGVLAGMIYALVVFPRSASMHRPRETEVDRLVGGAALGALAAAAVWTCIKLVAG